MVSKDLVELPCHGFLSGRVESTQLALLSLDRNTSGIEEVEQYKIGKFSFL